MVIHVGVSSVLGQISTYNTDTKTFDDYKISQGSLFEYDITNIDQKLKKINSKVVGEKGCVCVDFGWRSQDFRRHIVESALAHGFKKILLIGSVETKFYTVISQSNHNHESSNFIFISDESTVYIWQKQNGLFKGRGREGRSLFFFITVVPPRKLSTNRLKNKLHIDKFDVKTDLNGINVDEPKVIYYSQNSNKNLIEKVFPDFEYIYYESLPFNYSRGALYKARLMGDDPTIVNMNVKNLFLGYITLTVNDMELIGIWSSETLPLTKRFIFEPCKNGNVLKVYKISESLKEFKLPNFVKTLITFTIDINEIYSVKLENILIDIADKRHIVENINSLNVDFEMAYKFPAKTQINDDKFNAVGIDLGTTRCCAAVHRKSGIETVALDNQGQRLLPSYVAFDEENVKCGQLVVDRLRNFASSTVFDSKRLLGKRLSQIKTNNSWPFELEEIFFCKQFTESYEQRTECLIKLSKSEENVVYKSPEEIAAVLLQQIKLKAEEFQGKKLTEAVITVPAAFDEEQMKATYEAGIIAGWETIHLLPEPVAAAFAYFVDRPIPNNKTLLLFDLGGGTLDVCLFKIQKNTLKIISRSGDPNLGGRDFDDLLLNYFTEKLQDEYGIEVPENKKYKLLQECQKIKENLSTLEEDILDVENIDPSSDSNVAISRDQFEVLSIDLIVQIYENITAALDKTDLTKDQINKVLQVGGGCRMPVITKLLQGMFPNSEHIREQNPEEVVAVGAAYYAYYLNNAPEDKRCSII